MRKIAYTLNYVNMSIVMVLAYKAKISSTRNTIAFQSRLERRTLTFSGATAMAMRQINCIACIDWYDTSSIFRLPSAIAQQHAQAVEIVTANIVPLGRDELPKYAYTCQIRRKAAFKNLEGSFCE